jgi:hypothetical protein
MTTFNENLAGLPGTDGIACLELTDSHGTKVATIENKAGSQGSLRVYRHLADRHGAITPAAAQEGLDLYAEHTSDARANPGKHPNIDRLIDLIDRGPALSVHVIFNS